MSDMTFDGIVEAALLGETTEVEFKSAKGGFPASFWATYSAMANTDGGTIVLGAQEKSGRIGLDGLSQELIAHYKKQLWDDLHNRSTVSLNLLQNAHLRQIEFDGKYLLVVTVPVAARRQKPVYRGAAPFGNTYRRNHEGDYRCSDDEVRRMFADADPDNTPDMLIVEGFTLGDIDSASLTQYRQRFRSVKGDHPWLALEDQALLENLGGWRLDRRTDRSGLTIAGLLMFGRYNAITAPEGVPGYFVDYRESLDPQTRWTDRVYPDGTWEPNLFQFYQRVWPKIAAGLQVPFQLENGVRRDETLVHVALREAFVNALIHSDYRAPGGVVVLRHPDRFVFDNPGTLLVSVEQYRKGGISECRNKALQKMFSMIGGGERAGSGVDKIRSGWSSRHWRAPLLNLSSGPDRVQLTLPMVSLIPRTSIIALEERFGAVSGTWSPSQVQALATAQMEGTVSNSRLQELLGEHPADISKMLQRLCEEGYLVSDNKRRWASYRLPGQPTEPSLLGVLQEVGHSGDSIHRAPDSIHRAPDSIHSDGSAAIDGDSFVRTVAEPVARRRRVSPELMRQVILQLCGNRFLTLRQMAEVLHRNATAFRNQYLVPMVRQGLLSLRYPESPNRPDQAYTATKPKFSSPSTQDGDLAPKVP